MLNLTNNHFFYADKRISSFMYTNTVSHIIRMLGLISFIVYSVRLILKRYGTPNMTKLTMLTHQDTVPTSTPIAEDVKNTLSSAYDSPTASKVLSVNYHFTRRCNYRCGFCFHTAKTSFELPIDKAKEGLRLLKEAGKFSTSTGTCLCGWRCFKRLSKRTNCLNRHNKRRFETNKQKLAVSLNNVAILKSNVYKHSHNPCPTHLCAPCRYGESELQWRRAVPTQ